MTPQKLDEIMVKYRVSKSRFAYLQSEMITLERWLAICKGEMINDRISLSQAITGMPHGSGVGDPTGRLATDIASGDVSTFVRQVEEDIERAKQEMETLSSQIRIVENVLEALNDREREVLVFKIIDGRDWADTVDQMNGLHNNTYSKRTLQRLLDRALDKAYEVVQ